LGDTREFQLPDDLSLIVCYVPKGDFMMGSSEGEDRFVDDPEPRKVTIHSHYWVGRTELTQAQWNTLMEVNPSRFQEDETRFPVENVSWFEAQEFIDRLNREVELPGGWVWSLPSQSLWEHACRAGADGPFPDPAEPAQIAWYDENSGVRTHPVATLEANAYGLHDMHGNVREWCIGMPTDEVGMRLQLPGRSFRMVRGGSILSDRQRTRAGFPDHAHAYDSHGGDVGLRVFIVRDPDEAGSLKMLATETLALQADGSPSLQINLPASATAATITSTSSFASGKGGDERSRWTGFQIAAPWLNCSPSNTILVGIDVIPPLVTGEWKPYEDIFNQEVTVERQREQAGLLEAALGGDQRVLEQFERYGLGSGLDDLKNGDSSHVIQEFVFGPGAHVEVMGVRSIPLASEKWEGFEGFTSIGQDWCFEPVYFALVRHRDHPEALVKIQFPLFNHPWFEEVHQVAISEPSDEKTVEMRRAYQRLTSRSFSGELEDIVPVIEIARRIAASLEIREP